MNCKKGITLTELLIAAAILVTMLLPIYGLFGMNTRQAEFNESWGVALELARSAMERIISEDVPFQAIQPEGFGSGTKALGNGRSQADFDDSGPYAAYKLKSILGGGPSGYTIEEGDRAILKKGLKYKILFFAGVYRDDPSSPPGGSQTEKQKNNADPAKELTFSYYPNPWFDAQNDCAEDATSALGSAGADPSGCKVSGRRPVNPYKQLSGAVAGKYYSNGVNDALKPNFRPGFPSPKNDSFADGHSSGNNRQAEEDKPEGGAGAPSATAYNPRYEDIVTHNPLPGNGGLMKVVIGVRWKPRGPGGAGSAREDQEFYLVSFKANLSRD